MDDFLHKLRSNNKRFDNNSRQHNNQQKNSFERQSRSRRHEGFGKNISDKLFDILGEILPDIKYFLEENTRRHQQMLAIEEHRVVLEEQQIQAFHSIATSIARLAGNSTQNSSAGSPSMHEEQNVVESPVDSSMAQENIQTKDAASMASSPQKQRAPLNLGRKEVMNLIMALRKEGQSFKQVAVYLGEQNIPTFSGKGRWHAPTVANLLKK
jgi:hypothetical protein